MSARASAIRTLDAALSQLRLGAFGRVRAAMVAGVPLACALIACVYFERVEGLRAARPMLACALAAGFAWRAVALGRVTRALVSELCPQLLAAEYQPSRVLSVALSAAIGTWIWGWPLVYASRWSVVWLLGLLPIVALRNAMAPGWLARAACGRARGVSVLTHAAADAKGMRGMLLTVQLCGMGALGAVFLNLCALAALVLLVLESLFGLSLGFMSALLSHDNELWITLIATVAFVLVEPLWAAISAQAFVAARTRRDGADLDAAIDQLIRARVAPGRAYSLLVAVSIAWLLGSSPVHAQPTAAGSGPGAHDARVTAQVETILRGHEFAELPRAPESDFDRRLQRWLDRLLAEHEHEQPAPPHEHSGDGHAAAKWVMLVAAGSLLALLALSLGGGSWRRSRPPPVTTPDEDTLRGAGVEESWLQRAERLAAQGELRQALRVVYLGVPRTLEAARVIGKARHQTNGQHVRALPVGALRDQLTQLTTSFERSAYGAQPVSAADYAQARELAERVYEREQEARR